ncbi:hypothetical protein MtrunA17_Chr7g0219011 [Medicago truncatula]|uniref:Transmembrane protein, putative n=1 Tax=Medicago truncatula TaxID=3880 RepID=A0A072TVW6_MEDTR|nr:transmembrane protein, putative [Medicago truncatula]RHN44397.1 hypothetical protein MtrunA17_Chr7g0219011 [Medicago truncatula]
MSSNKVIWVLMLTLVVLATISQAICPDGNYGQPCNGFDKTCCDKSLVCNGGFVGTCLCRNGNILNCDKPKKCKTFSEKCNGFDKKCCVGLLCISGLCRFPTSPPLRL